MTSAHKLALVGSTNLTEEQAQEANLIINKVIAELQPATVISGGAEGIDSIAEETAKLLGYNEDDDSLVIFLPENRRWEPNGFRTRNMLIAEASTILICIRSKQSKTYGSGWTADYAESLGKLVGRILL